MKQLIQNFKTGELYVDELPAPSISSGMVLVQNDFSLICAGTERGTIKWRSPICWARPNSDPIWWPRSFRYQKEGLAATINKVRTDSTRSRALGYSTSAG
ncbi:MAG: hypothetical protein R2824_23860 [Saprospiraceae bacterium]